MQFYLERGLGILLALGGVVLTITTLSAAVRSFVLPRNETVRLNILVFVGIRKFFDFAARQASNYARRDRIMAHYAPVALVALPVSWLTLVCLGYVPIYHLLGVGSWEQCYELSGSSMLTLGTTSDNNLIVNIFTYSEATLGLLLLTLLLSYLPTLYQAFSRRETVVAQLELRAGVPPTACGLLAWLGGQDGDFTNDDAQWLAWEQWLVELDESLTSLPILAFFRSPQSGRSWVTAAGLVLDAANLLFSALDAKTTRQVQLTFSAGCLALNRIQRYFDRKAETPVTELRSDTEQAAAAPGREAFEQAWANLAELGLPLMADQAAAWQHYQQRRLRYAPALEFLQKLLMAPAPASK